VPHDGPVLRRPGGWAGDGPVVRALLDELDPDRSRIADFSVRTASLDDVFLTLTGHTAESETPDD
jgi:ABC-2 type transport system ATP-binding protein